MVLPVNLKGASDVYGELMAAEATRQQGLGQQLENTQKSREMQEWSSKEQKKMRQSQTRANTAAATKAANYDEAENKFIEQNPELVQEANRSGIMAKVAKSWGEVRQEESDAFSQYFGDIDFSDPSQVRSAYVNAQKDPSARNMVSRMPPLSAILQGDEQAINEAKLLQGGFYQDRKFRQSLALAEKEGEIRGDLQSQQGSIQMGLQQQAQGSAITRDKILHGYDMEKLKASAGLDFQLQMAKARASATAKPAKIEDFIPGGIAAFTTNTTGPMIAGLLESSDISLSDEQMMQLVSDVSSLALNEWQKLQRMFESGEISSAPDLPGVLAQKIAVSKLATNIEEGTFGDTYLTDDQARLKAEQKAKEDAITSEFLSSRQKDRVRQKLSTSPEFNKLSPEDQEKLIQSEIDKRIPK